MSNQKEKKMEGAKNKSISFVISYFLRVYIFIPFIAFFCHFVQLKAILFYYFVLLQLTTFIIFFFLDLALYYKSFYSTLQTKLRWRGRRHSLSVFIYICECSFSLHSKKKMMYLKIQENGGNSPLSNE